MEGVVEKLSVEAEREIAEQIRAGNKLGAVKTYKLATGTSLMAAKTAVEAMMSGESYSPQDLAAGPNQDQILDAIFANKKLNAVKLYKASSVLRGWNQRVHRSTHGATTRRESRVVQPKQRRMCRRSDDRHRASRRSDVVGRNKQMLWAPELPSRVCPLAGAQSADQWKPHLRRSGNTLRLRYRPT